MKLIDGPPIPLEDIQRILNSSIPFGDKNNPDEVEQCQVRSILLQSQCTDELCSLTSCARRRMDISTEYARYLSKKIPDCGRFRSGWLASDQPDAGIETAYGAR
jgi:hypothetical protein